MPRSVLIQLFHHAWAFFLAVSVLKVVIGKYRSRRYIRENPELADGYARLFWGVLLSECLPWVYIGFAVESGAVRNVFAFVRPRDGNPFVQGWFVLLMAEWLLGFWWLFFRGGAEFIVRHPGVSRYDAKNPVWLKVWYCVGGLSMMVVFTFFWYANLPEFPFDDGEAKGRLGL